MWRQSDSEKKSSSENARDASKPQEDSGVVDSGILSDNILLSSEISGDIESTSQQPVERPDVSAASMRADSGLDLGLSESLSHLSLQNTSLNQLGQRSSSSIEKVQEEPVLEPILVQVQEDQEGDDESIEPWQLCYVQDSDGDTQLHIAIIQGFLEEPAMSLIKMAPHSCLLDIRNDDGLTPLHLAVLTKQPRLVRRLILGGADPSLRDSHGNTALHLASRNGDLMSARALTDPLAPIERNYLGAHRKIPALPQNLEQLNFDGETCLHMAARKDQVDIVRLLLRLGANLEATEGLCGRTPLHLAAECSSHAVITFLVHECRPCLDATTYAGLTAYQLLVINNDIELANDLVKHGATQEPPPESDSSEEISDDSDEDDDCTQDMILIMERVGVQT